MRVSRILLSAVIVMAVTALNANAATATFGRGQAGEYGVDKIDMVSLHFSQWNHNVTGLGSADAYIQTGDYDTWTGTLPLIGFANLFTEVPPTSGGDVIVIDNATLEVIADLYDTSAILTVNRVVTDWLGLSAGLNQSNVHDDLADIAGNVEWTSDPDGSTPANGEAQGDPSFGPLDWTSNNSDSNPMKYAYNPYPNNYSFFDVTYMLQDAYDAGIPFSVCVMTDSTLSKSLQDAGNTTGNQISPAKDPMLTIAYHYEPSVPLFALTVVSGTGDDSSVAEGEIRDISADAAPAGQGFDQWTGDITNIDDVNNPDTFITMPAADVTVTATYADQYALTVISGTGDGDYFEAAVVNIAADVAPTGQAFDQWVGDITGIANLFAQSTTITMPAAAATITATYVSTSADLTVIGGTGSGTYNKDDVVAISADTAPTGDVFYKWLGDVATLDSIYDANTTLVMPQVDITVTATYITPGAYSLTIVSGSGDGMYDSGEVIDIFADAAPSGKFFYMWLGETTGITDVNTPCTTITMPAGDATITAAYTNPVQHTILVYQDPSDQYEYAMFDDTGIAFSTGSLGGGDGTGVIINVGIGDEETSGKISLIGIADLFNILPYEIDGNSIWIHDSKLTLGTDFYPGHNSTIEINRMLTDWLTQPAGENQGNIHADASDKLGGTEWASEPDGTTGNIGNGSTIFTSWGSGDYDANGVSMQWVSGYNSLNTFDVTDLVQAIYDNHQNYGFVVRMTSPGYNVPSGQDPNVIWMSSVEGPRKPLLEITYSHGEPTKMYMLTVESGSGDGPAEAGLPTPIVADTPPAGMEFNMWSGDVDNIADREAASTTILMPHSDVSVTATWKTFGAPTDWWPTFNEFCKTFFGAEREPLTYQMFGSALQFMTLPDSEWVYPSQTSACIAFETNLPAISYIEYGETTGYGNIVDVDPDWDGIIDRYHYIHVGYLTGLTNHTTYHYRFVAEDERGNIITSPDKTFLTYTPLNLVLVPGTMGSPPYNLVSGKYYLVTQDIVADDKAFIIANDNDNFVTLDLGGHTVIYNNVDDPPVPPGGDPNFPYSYINDSDYGVLCYWNETNVGIYNGRFVQGAGATEAYSAGWGSCPISFEGTRFGNEVAGITAQWNGAQVKGFNLTPGVSAHHNVLLDRGWQLTSRHQGASAINMGNSVHHNLILRARHRGVYLGTNVYNNEIYTDSFYANSFGIGAASYSSIHDNRVFGGGYNLEGLAALGANWSTGDPNQVFDPSKNIRNVTLSNNFVHLQAEEPYDYRSLEYGEKSDVITVRSAWGSDNVLFEDNILISYVREGGESKGIWLLTDHYSYDLIFRNNVIKTIMEDDLSTDGAAITVTGYETWGADPIVFENNRIISNYLMVRFGESYGVGDNTRWVSNTFVKEGQEHPLYDLMQVGYSTSNCVEHYLIDSSFEGGTDYNDVVFVGTNPLRNYYVGWFLTIETDADANVIIQDYLGTEVFNGQADANGVCTVELLQYKAEPDPVGLTYYTDHTVTVETDANTYVETVTMDASKTVQIPAVNNWPGDLNKDQACDIVDLNMVLIDWGKTGAAITDPRADGNGDGTVDIIDLNLVLIDWGKTGYAP